MPPNPTCSKPTVTKTKKAVAYCTAYMNVVEEHGRLTVGHCFAHCGHETRPSLPRLDDNAKEYIASLLAEGLTVRQAYRKLRPKVRECPKTKLYFTTVRDVRNIANKCRVQPDRLDNIDTVSVQMRVEANAESDGIQFFRAAQESSGDGFVLGS
ncbi:hypothetical protein OESDEN_21841 [Oesophagostomum dentatum]|uniref:Uncharacterized protein n=1 Tax=Oesophagostomum dentatum TaxID=61180 RepID=A0A0B1S4X7_OESDE|nr:hypothetical protein OESDEN_21841 [Oesophagostomum dentatum]